MKLYDIIVTDPPWAYYGDQEKIGAAGKEYKLMTDEQILDFKYPLAPKGILFMWATCPRLDMALFHLMQNDLHYRGVGFVWVKTSKKGEPIGAQGVRPSITKPLTELVICGSKVAKGRPMQIASESICQTIFETRGDHSQKPEEMQSRIEALYPDATKAEFFARRRRPGWDCFGDELPPESDPF